MTSEQVRLVSVWQDAGRPCSFEFWYAAYTELDRMYRECAVARQLGADRVELEFYEAEARRLEQVVGA